MKAGYLCIASVLAHCLVEGSDLVLGFGKTALSLGEVEKRIAYTIKRNAWEWKTCCLRKSLQQREVWMLDVEHPALLLSSVCVFSFVTISWVLGAFS